MGAIQSTFSPSSNVLPMRWSRQYSFQNWLGRTRDLSRPAPVMPPVSTDRTSTPLAPRMSVSQSATSALCRSQRELSGSRPWNAMVAAPHVQQDPLGQLLRELHAHGFLRLGPEGGEAAGPVGAEGGPLLEDAHAGAHLRGLHGRRSAGDPRADDDHVAGQGLRDGGVRDRLGRDLERPASRGYAGAHATLPSISAYSCGRMEPRLANSWTSCRNSPCTASSGMRMPGGSIRTGFLSTI